MKKLLYLLISCVLLCGTMMLTGCDNNPAGTGGSADGGTSAEAAKESVEESIIGTWVLSELDGQPALTNVKGMVETFTRVNYDFSKAILGTWEGRCTSEGSVFDDGQDHRWEYKDDGTTFTATYEMTKVEA